MKLKVQDDKNLNRKMPKSVDQDTLTDRNRRTLWIFRIIMWSISIFVIAIAAIIVPMMPDTIPIHFDIHGHADRWGSGSGVFLIPLVTNITFAGIWFLMELFVRRFHGIGNDSNMSLYTSLKILLIGGIWVQFLLSLIAADLLYGGFKQISSFSDNDIIIRLSGVAIGVCSCIAGMAMPLVKGMHISGLPKDSKPWKVLQYQGSAVFLATGVLMLLLSVLLRGIWIIWGFFFAASIEAAVLTLLLFRARRMQYTKKEN
ncbi:DUF1648 domain-containing protein [Bombiscardovia apis]|uniref:DUF1648 domain-containing protein n=1 Tax=Bombiscardovia apis TaxID=2932182 RepID=UPI002953F244|nr:DUF1648 domain-containing protein [Bombiscardovia apis]